MVLLTAFTKGVSEAPMSSFTQGLKDKIEGLRDERGELEDAMSRIDTKIETLEELLAEEEGTSAAKPTTKRKRGRPKGSKKITEVSKRDKELYDEAVATLPEAPTTPEMQERLVNRYRPTPRATESRGPGITAGTKEEVRGKDKKSDKTITIEDA